MDLPLNYNQPLTMHIDLNSCFAIIEQQANPLIRHKPVAVAAYDSPRGAVIASSYEAKALGIKLMVNVREARMLCKDVIILTPDPEKYFDAHRRFKKVLLNYTDEVTPKSVDEFVVDFKGSQAIQRGLSLEEVGYRIKQDIKESLGEYITVNIGIATNRFLAKVGAGLHKPDGLDIISAVVICIIGLIGWYVFNNRKVDDPLGQTLSNLRDETLNKYNFLNDFGHDSNLLTSRVTGYNFSVFAETPTNDSVVLIYRNTLAQKLATHSTTSGSTWEQALQHDAKTILGVEASIQHFMIKNDFKLNNEESSSKTHNYVYERSDATCDVSLDYDSNYIFSEDVSVTCDTTQDFSKVAASSKAFVQAYLLIHKNANATTLNVGEPKIGNSPTTGYQHADVAMAPGFEMFYRSVNGPWKLYGIWDTTTGSNNISIGIPCSTLAKSTNQEAKIALAGQCTK